MGFISFSFAQIHILSICPSQRWKLSWSKCSAVCLHSEVYDVVIVVFPYEGCLDVVNMLFL